MDPVKMPKFGTIDSKPIHYGNHWMVRKAGPMLQLWITTDYNPITLIKKLLTLGEGPYGLLYILNVARATSQPGRYQGPLLDQPSLFQWLDRFADYLSGDGRHHLWFYDLSQSTRHPRIVYNNHEIIIAYGAIERIETYLRQQQFSESEIHIPAPHAHSYNVQFDDDEEAILKSLEWTLFPLQPDDEVGL